MSVQHGPFEFMGFLGLVFFLVWTLAASVRLASSGERPSNTGERGRVVATVASSTRTV
jgi:hypothetical protein